MYVIILKLSHKLSSELFLAQDFNLKTVNKDGSMTSATGQRRWWEQEEEWWTGQCLVGSTSRAATSHRDRKTVKYIKS